MTLPLVLERALLGLLVLGAAIWMGGFVAIVVVSVTSRESIEPAQRVALFRGLGRGYLRVAIVALVLVALPGGVLLALRPWDGFSLAIVLVALLLVALSWIGVRQARRMTRMRRDALASAPADENAVNIARHAKRAWTLRMGIGLASLALFVIVLATP